MLIVHSLASRLEPGCSSSKSGVTRMGAGCAAARASSFLTDLPGNYFPGYYLCWGMSRPTPARANARGVLRIRSPEALGSYADRYWTTDRGHPTVADADQMLSRRVSP